MPPLSPVVPPNLGDALWDLTNLLLFLLLFLPKSWVPAWR